MAALRKVAVAPLALGIIALSACSGGDGGGEAGAVAFGDFGRGEAEVDGAIVMPSVDDLVFIRQAEEELIRSCMEDAGFEYVPQHVDGSNVADPFDFGMVAPSYLRSFGYGTSLDPTIRSGVDLDAPTVTLPPTPNDEIVATLSPEESAAWHEALSGSEAGSHASMRMPDGSELDAGTDGCSARAGIDLYGSVEAYVNFFNGSDVIAGDALRRMGEAPDYVAVVTDWYGCMNAAGYDPGGAPNGGRLAWEAYRDLPVEQAR